MGYLKYRRGFTVMLCSFIQSKIYSPYDAHAYHACDVLARVIIKAVLDKNINLSKRTTITQIKDFALTEPCSLGGERRYADYLVRLISSNSYSAYYYLADWINSHKTELILLYGMRKSYLKMRRRGRK